MTFKRKCATIELTKKETTIAEYTEEDFKKHRAYVRHVREKQDPYMWKRYQAAQKLGMDEKDLADEPDNLPENPEENWDEELHGTELSD